jgi:hypothetical protein
MKRPSGRFHYAFGRSVAIDWGYRTGVWVPSKSPPKPVAATVPLSASRLLAQVAHNTALAGALRGLLIAFRIDIIWQSCLW